MRTIGCLCVLVMAGCGTGSSWHDAGFDVSDVRPALTTAEAALVGTYARDTTDTGGGTLHVIEEFRADHTSVLTFGITLTCGLATTAIVTRTWTVDSGLLNVTSTTTCHLTDTSSMCRATNGQDYCTSAQPGGMFSYSLSGATLTIEPPAGGEGGSYTRLM